LANQFKVLVVDDDLDDQLLIEEAFQTGDMQCDLQFASDGRQALSILDKNSSYIPDLIVLDLNMPVMNGFEVLSHLQVTSLFPRIPVVVLTTTAEADYIDKSYDLGAKSFIVKPKSFRELETIANNLKEYWFKTVSLARIPFKGCDTGRSTR